jgi:hypothetical protein
MTDLAREANLRVEMDCTRSCCSGDMLAISSVKELPPRASDSSRVSFESLKGMCLW